MLVSEMFVHCGKYCFTDLL